MGITRLRKRYYRLGKAGIKRRPYYQWNIERNGLKLKFIIIKATSLSKQSRISLSKKTAKLSRTFLVKRNKQTTLDGRRIVNLHCLEKLVSKVSLHVTLCKDYMGQTWTQSPIQLVGECRRQGLATILRAKCRGCSMVWELAQSDRMSGNPNHGQYVVNVAAV